jgi:hypothetical protein
LKRRSIIADCALIVPPIINTDVGNGHTQCFGTAQPRLTGRVESKKSTNNDRRRLAASSIHPIFITDATHNNIYNGGIQEVMAGDAIKRNPLPRVGDESRVKNTKSKDRHRPALLFHPLSIAEVINNITSTLMRNRNR